MSNEKESEVFFWEGGMKPIARPEYTTLSTGVNCILTHRLNKHIYVRHMAGLAFAILTNIGARVCVCASQLVCR